MSEPAKIKIHTTEVLHRLNTDKEATFSRLGQASVLAARMIYGTMRQRGSAGGIVTTESCSGQSNSNESDLTRLMYVTSGEAEVYNKMQGCSGLVCKSGERVDNGVGSLQK
jgi:hypothetical protein